MWTCQHLILRLMGESEAGCSQGNPVPGFLRAPDGQADLSLSSLGHKDHGRRRKEVPGLSGRPGGLDMYGRRVGNNYDMLMISCPPIDKGELT